MLTLCMEATLALQTPGCGGAPRFVQKLWFGPCVSPCREKVLGTVVASVQLQRARNLQREHWRKQRADTACEFHVVAVMFDVRGALLTRGSDSSFRGSAQKVSLRTDHIEDEVEDQEDGVEYERDCEECKVESRREVRHTGA